MHDDGADGGAVGKACKGGADGMNFQTLGCIVLEGMPGFDGEYTGAPTVPRFHSPAAQHSRRERHSDAGTAVGVTGILSDNEIPIETIADLCGQQSRW